MRIIKTLVTLFIVNALLPACNSNEEKKEQKVLEDEFKYVPLKDLKYEEAIIKPGTEVEILANLGGRSNSGDTVYYYQFIVKNKETLDTLRILCPEITIDEAAGIDNKTSTTPLAFNPSKGVTTAFFELIDTSKSLLLNEENLSKLPTEGDSIDINHLLDPATTIKMAALDKKDSEHRIFRFRTAIGILNFKKIPW